MADIRVMGPFEGPGERRTVETLGAELPDDWILFSGRKLPGIDRDDNDLIVVATGTIFVLDEKSWGPRVVLDDVVWSTSSRDYRNPLDRVAVLARKLASMFKAKTPGYVSDIGVRHIVTPGVVLSHPELECVWGENWSKKELVFGLNRREASKGLVAFDKGSKAFTKGLRGNIIATLEGFPQRSSGKHRIGPYEVQGSAPPIGRAERFWALEPETSELVLLLCYPLNGWGPDVNPRDLLKREASALSRLSEMGRSVACLTSFEDSINQYFVTPMRWLKEARNLQFSVAKQDPIRIDGKVDQETAQAIVLDAFKALRDVHSVGLVHRALDPRRIFISRQSKIKFTDFLIARVEGEGTISPWLDDFESDTSIRFRAPEIVDDPRFATPVSDVYSLALCLAIWLLNEDCDAVETTEVQDRISGYPKLGSVLAGCLESDVENRLSLDRVIQRLESESLAIDVLERVSYADSDASENAEWEVGTTIANRFLLKRRLGEGSYAITWLAADTQHDQERTLKLFKTDEAARSARNEFEIASRLVSERCARVWDLISLDGKTVLVNEFVEGENLLEFVTPMTSPEDIRGIALDVLEGLGYIHSKNLLHVDVSPSNIIVEPSGRAKLIDFGLVGEIGNARRAGAMQFMAPEILGGETPTVSTDIHSFAATFARVMLGRDLFNYDIAHPTERTIMPATSEEEREWGSLGASMLKCFFRGLSANPKERPQSAAQFAADLNMALDQPLGEGVMLENEWVALIRGLYRGSAIGNEDMRGLDTEFARKTYVTTRLDTELLKRVMAGDYGLVALTGNPGDGKTSFIQMVRQQLVSSGGTVLREDLAGWQVELGARTFIAVYDASESNGKLSSDEVMHAALSPLLQDGSSSVTVLLAANDGRLLQFFDDFDDEFESIGKDIVGQLRRGLIGVRGRHLLVDLKRRSMAGQSEDSTFGIRLLDRLTDDEFWSVCQGCSARQSCPMRANRDILRGPARETVQELVLISHLRRARRATVRDLRSAFAWLITGDRSCKDVHHAILEGRDLTRGGLSMVHDLSFSNESDDYLIQEWSQLDPAWLPTPEIERLADRNLSTSDSPSLTQQLSTMQRMLFFGELKLDGIDRSVVSAYQHLEEFKKVLMIGDDESRSHVIDLLLLGASRIVGAKGFTGKGLAISSADQSSEWAVLRLIKNSDFQLEVQPSNSEFIETVPEFMSLVHDGHKLQLTLDIFELLMRAANGEIVNDRYSESLRLDIERYANQIRRQPAHRVVLIDSRGGHYVATKSAGEIVIENR